MLALVCSTSSQVYKEKLGLQYSYHTREDALCASAVRVHAPWGRSCGVCFGGGCTKCLDPKLHRQQESESQFFAQPGVATA